MAEDSFYTPLDRSGSLPLYAQIAQRLADDIRERRLSAGAVLPSEAVLCKQFGVARSVVRQALALLATDGLIHREQGRPAIVAAGTELRRLVQRSAGLYDQFASVGTLLRTRVLRLEPAEPPNEVVKFFVSKDTWLLERLRRIDDVPLAFVRTWLPRQRVPALQQASLEDASLHHVLAQTYGIRPGRGRNRIRAVAADHRLAELLQVEPGSPLLQLEGQGLDTHERPMEWFTTWHRPEQLVFDVEVGPSGEQVQAAISSGSRPSAAAETSGTDPLDQAESLLSSALDALRRARKQY